MDIYSYYIKLKNIINTIQICADDWKIYNIEDLKIIRFFIYNELIADINLIDVDYIYYFKNGFERINIYE